MQIRTLFLLCMGTTAALGTCLSGWVLVQMVVEYRLAGRVERVVDIDNLLFVAADKLSAERPLTGDALLEEGPPDRATHERLGLARGESDAALAQVERRIAERAFFGADAQQAIVRKIASDLVELRAGADAALTAPRGQRDPASFPRYLTRANAMFDMTSRALDVGDMAAALHDGTMVELIALSRLAWNLRATMTLRTAPLMTAIGAGAELAPDTLAAQLRVDGIVKSTWNMIDILTTRLSDIPGLPASVARARGAFDTYEGLCQELMRRGASSAVYPVSALEFGRAATRTAPVLLQLRDDAVSAARARVTRNRQLAGNYVIVAAVVLAVTVLAIAAVLMLLQRRIVSPVLNLTNAIDRIARLDFDVSIPQTHRLDEIGRMAVALEALRRGAMDGEAQKAQIAHMAHHDALTGLANRIVLQERVERAVLMAARDHISAALCLDLDGFKAVNDTFGHATGDLLLQAVAERLRLCIREVDLAARTGGDEFVVLLMGIESGESAAAVARRIVRAIGEPFDLDGQSVTVGTSIGIAITPQDARTGDALLNCADLALYRAKSDGKGGWRFFMRALEERGPVQDPAMPKHVGRETERRTAGQILPLGQGEIAPRRVAAPATGESCVPHRLHSA